MNERAKNKQLNEQTNRTKEKAGIMIDADIGEGEGEVTKNIKEGRRKA